MRGGLPPTYQLDRIIKFLVCEEPLMPHILHGADIFVVGTGGLYSFWCCNRYKTYVRALLSSQVGLEVVAIGTKPTQLCRM